MAAVAREMSGGQPFEGGIRRKSSSRRTAPYGRETAPAVPRASELPRSASYTYIQEAKQHFPSETVLTTCSDVNIRGPGDDVTDPSTPDSSGWTTPDEHVLRGATEQPQDIVAELHKSPKMAPHNFTEARRDSDESSLRTVRTSMDSAATRSTVATTPGSHTPRVSVTSNFSRKLNRRSWTDSNASTPAHSRSPSPPKKDPSALSREVAPETNGTPHKESLKDRHKSLLKKKASTKVPKQAVQKEHTPQSSDSEQPVARKSTILRAKSSRPMSGLFRSLTNDDQVKKESDKRRQPSIPPVPRIALPQSFSTDRLPNLQSAPHSPGLTPPLPRPLTSHKAGGLSLPKKKDELWSHFRTLDAEFSKFSSKSLAFKANVVRSSLLPFLRTYANHPSNRTLRPEDLDRRANILNKWWTGLIEMLHGRNNQSISGTDRPAILDGIAGIMERSEWRLYPSPFCPLNLRMKGFSARNQSSASLSSGQSDFLAESVHHNVRNIFIQNLTAQMAFVVDKMSLRNASASLVTFCGKACAYAFMFVPGMADILVRLWDLQMDTLRRVLAENKIGKFDILPQTHEHIMAGFPPALQQLGFFSLLKYMRKLRTPPSLPVGTHHIQWWGHWLQRWTGRESDLFYVFAKHFHILVTDFLPTDVSREERMCAPGILLVESQILTNLDATIHREANATQQDPTAVGPSPTFDDVLADSADAYAPAISLPPSNAIRSMVENRTIMLVREFLSERAASHPIARRLFAESMNDLFQAAARATSMYDHAACYTLLDLLEEGLALLVRFEHIGEHDGEIVDGKFWKEVCTKMIDSKNTMTKVRLFAFVYTIWGSLVSDAGRKDDVCFGLLLDPVIFESMFNHWCPMVRAYYMRLLCWRLGRYDGEPCVGDMGILETLMQRLQQTWCHYLYLREEAERKQRMLPSTSPCNPAPSRRLWIVRTDPQLNPSDALMSFDGIMAPESKAPSIISKRISMISTYSERDTRPDSSYDTSDSEAEPRGRGIGGFFKNLLTSKSRSRSRGPPARCNSAMSAASAPPVPNGSQRSDTPMVNGITRSATDDLQASKKSTAQEARAPQHRNFSFKFSLEHQPNSKPIPAMRLAPPRLPLPAHQYISSHSDRLTPMNQLRPLEPTGASKEHARYCGRALAEWQLILGECHSFFDRRKGEGMPADKHVETPALGVEVFKRPG